MFFKKMTAPKPGEATLMDLKDIPAWLETPVNFYKTTGKNFRFDLFKYCATNNLAESTIKVVSIILNLFQLSIIMLDDIFDKTVSRRGEKAMHMVHGPVLVSTWAIGITHYIYQISTACLASLGNDMHVKFNQLYGEVGIRTLRGQFYELTIKDYREIVRYKTAYYTVCFPVAVYVLLKTGDLEQAFEIMEDKELQELGYLFQAENDFKGAFEADNTDIEMKSWTILIDMAAKKNASFVYPEFKEEAVEIFQKYDLYNQYVKDREAGLQALRETVAEMKLSELSLSGTPAILKQAKQQAIEYCLEFFESYKYQSTNLKEGATKSANDLPRYNPPYPMSNPN